MSPLVLTTKDGGDAVQIADLPEIPANGVGGITLDTAAGGIRQLQQHGQPLEGKQLEKAAREFADRQGLTVKSISDAKAAKLVELAGGHPDRPPAVEVAEQLAARHKRAAADAAEVAPEPDAAGGGEQS